MFGKIRFYDLNCLVQLEFFIFYCYNVYVDNVTGEIFEEINGTPHQLPCVFHLNDIEIHENFVKRLYFRSNTVDIINLIFQVSNLFISLVTRNWQLILFRDFMKHLKAFITPTFYKMTNLNFFSKPFGSISIFFGK